MARSFVRASSQYGEIAQAAVTAVPFSVVAWVYPLDITNQQAVFSVCDSTATGELHQHTLMLRGNAASDPVRVRSCAGSTGQEASTTAGYVANAWQHIGGVFAATNSRSVYLNGGNKGTNVVSVTPAGLNITSFGRVSNANATKFYLDAYLAFLALYAGALTDTDMLMLQKFHPSLVRRDILIDCWDFWGNISPEPDSFGGLPVTITGASKIAQPPLILPSAPRLFLPGAASGAQTLSPSGIASGETFGAAVLSVGGVNLQPSGIGSSEAFGATVLSTGGVSIAPGSIGSGEAFGLLTVAPGAAIVSPSGIGSMEAFGTASLSPGVVSVLPTGIGSAESFGTPAVGDATAIPWLKSPTGATLTNSGQSSVTLSGSGRTGAEVE